MNLVIVAVTAISVQPLMNWLGLQNVDQEASDHSLLFFLKNISVIPLALVYVLMVCGIKPLNDDSHL